ncbi:MAG: amidohydrolase family protein [Actinobacteria bacterium]|nr:amidohydrolase family protein [Actinomycetota bacterium]
MAVGKGEADILLENGSKIGVEKYLVCSVATSVKQIPSITDFIADECAKHPEFIGLGAYHQDVVDPAPLLDRVDELGLKGVKLHPDIQRFNIDDPSMMPLYREAASRGQLILFHIGDNRYDFSSFDRLARVIDKVPDLRCIAAHLGGYQEWDHAHRLQGAHVYYDTSSSLRFINPETAAELIHRLGSDKMLFGVDFPMWNHAKELERFMKIGLSQEENAAILYDNFARLFDIE